MTQPRYTIAFAAPARRALRRLPEKVGTAAVEFIYQTLAANPRRVGKELSLELAGLYVARRGDYRVIYGIDDSVRRIDILAIEYRADVYRPR